MQKQIIIIAAVLAALSLSPLAFANSAQGSTSTPTTQWDSNGDMASGPGANAVGSVQTPGTKIQCQDGICLTVAPLPGQPATTAGYQPSYASGFFAYAGPGKGETVFGNDYASGNYAAALGSSSTAVGDSAGALGNGSTAVGTNSRAVGLGATALGLGSLAEGTAATATGADSAATGNFSTAEGAFARAQGTGSVALGAGSEANRANSVSVGNSQTGLTRQITNVAPGTQGTDAVNVNQLDGTAANLHQQIESGAQQLQQQFAGEINGVHSYATREADSVGALSAATADAAFSAAGLHTPNRVALGVGEMGGQVGESVAYQHAFGKHWTANATVAAGQAGMQVGVGAGFGW